MSFRSTDAATSIISALSWAAVAVMTFLAIFYYPKLHWFWGIPLGLTLAFVPLGYAIDCMAGEMTVRRWAIGQLVFTILAIVFILGGVFNAQNMFFPRWGLFTAGGIFSVSALLSAVAGKDVL